MSTISGNDIDRHRVLTVAGAHFVRESLKIESLLASLAVSFLRYFGNNSRLGFLHMLTREMSETHTHNNRENTKKIKKKSLLWDEVFYCFDQLEKHQRMTSLSIT